MEMHATIAVWDGKKFTLYETSQGVMNHQTVMAQVLGVPSENLEVITRFLGSGFGGKLFPWPHSALAAAAARQLNRPVKLVVSRKMMFSNVGHRPRTQQRMRLGATPDGKLVSLAHDYLNHTSFIDDITRKLRRSHALPLLRPQPPRLLRPGQAQRRHPHPHARPRRRPRPLRPRVRHGRARHQAQHGPRRLPPRPRHPHRRRQATSPSPPATSRNASQLGAEKFGWSKRTPQVGSMRKGDLILGWGVACASWGAGRGVAEATLSLRDDGTARVSSGTQDIGTGTYTVIAQVVSDKTGIPTSKIDVVLGSSSLVPGPMSGGSTATATVIPAVADAADAAIQQPAQRRRRAARTRPSKARKPNSLTLSAGRVHDKGKDPATGVPFDQILKAANVASANGDGKSGGLGSDTKARDYSTHSFGAQFVEVEWDPGIARLRVSRVVSVIDGGRIINPKTAANQIAGAVVMGIGMGLFEQTIYDPRNGHPINDNFADYIVPTPADCPADRRPLPRLPRPHDGRIRRPRHRRNRPRRRRPRHHRRRLPRHRHPRPRAPRPHRRPPHLKSRQSVVPR